MHVYINYYKKFFTVFTLLYIRMSRKTINFDDKKIEKSDFYENKKIFNIDNIDVNKILVSKKEPYDINKVFKYFIGYNDNDVIRPLYLRLLQMTGWTKKFEEDNTTTMFLRVKDKKRLKNYNQIWEKIESLTSIYFESKPVYGDKYIKTKIKIHKDSLFANFHNKKIPKEDAPCKCLSIIIILDSVIKTNKKYYPQTFLEECKYVREKIKTKNYNDEDLKSDSDSNDEQI